MLCICKKAILLDLMCASDNTSYMNFEKLGKMAKMTVIMDTPISRTNEIAKSKQGGPKTSSILLMSLAISLAIVLLTYAGFVYSESLLKQPSTCRDKMIGYEQKGMYRNSEQFRLALSYCGSK